jgi:ABC-2 type transport system ATP-binding protein
MEYAVKVQNLKKTFISGWWRKRRVEVLRGVDLEVPKGAFWGVLGSNGAGKTTFLSILSNLLTPDEGEVRILGEDLRTGAKRLRERINLSSGHANFLWSMTVRDNLNYYAMLYGLPRKRRKEKVDELLHLFQLTDFAGVRFDELSTGSKQKLSLSKALLNDPELLLLDEPTVGLDPDVARRLREHIRSLHRDRGVTILMTTHNMKEAEALCERVALIHEGVVKACGSPQQLKKEFGLGDSVRLSFQGILPPSAFERLEGIYSYQVGDSICRLVVDDHHARLPQILDLLHRCRISVHDLQIQETDLEDVFIAATK